MVVVKINVQNIIMCRNYQTKGAPMITGTPSIKNLTCYFLRAGGTEASFIGTMFENI